MAIVPIRFHSGLPRSVTHEQLGAVCDILGLPADDVVSLSADHLHVDAELSLRTEDGRALVAGYDGRPLYSRVQLQVTDDAEPPPATTYCQPLLVAQFRELPPTTDGWAQGEPTGRVCLVCPCGLITGWVPHDRVRQVFDAHAWRAEDDAPQETTT